MAAWAAARDYTRLAAMLGDPDPGVRQDIARAYLDAPDSQAVEPLFLDPDEMVRAALFVTRLLRGEWTEPPDASAISRSAAATAVRDAMPIETLRDIGPHRSRSGRAACRRPLALAVVGDESAYAVMRTDPIWAVRDRVGRMLAGWRGPPDARHSAMSEGFTAITSAIGLVLQPLSSAISSSTTAICCC